jgi:hypothetical protein
MQQCKLDLLPLGKKYSPTISFGSDSEDEDRGDSKGDDGIHRNGGGISYKGNSIEHSTKSIIIT